MIMEARKKNIYKQLFVDDLEHFSAVAETPYDMIVAADVLTYFGELQNVFDSFFVFSLRVEILFFRNP